MVSSKIGYVFARTMENHAVKTILLNKDKQKYRYHLVGTNSQQSQRGARWELLLRRSGHIPPSDSKRRYHCRTAYFLSLRCCCRLGTGTSEITIHRDAVDRLFGASFVEGELPTSRACHGLGTCRQ